MASIWATFSAGKRLWYMSGNWSPSTLEYWRSVTQLVSLPVALAATWFLSPMIIRKVGASLAYSSWMKVRMAEALVPISSV